MQTQQIPLREIINLVVTEVNDCDYTRRAHSMLAKSHGFTDEQVLAIRKVDITVRYSSVLNPRSQFFFPFLL